MSTTTERSPSTHANTLVLEPVVDRFGIAPVVLPQGHVRIGTGSDCDVVLEQSGIAECHGELVTTPTGTRVLALDPRTWLNNLPVQDAPVRRGDRIAIGPIEFRLRPLLPGETEPVVEPTERDAEAEIEPPRDDTLAEQLFEANEPIDDPRASLSEHLVRIDAGIERTTRAIADALHAPEPEEPVESETPADETQPEVFVHRLAELDQRERDIARRVALADELLEELQRTVAEELDESVRVASSSDERERRLDRVEQQLLEREQESDERRHEVETRAHEIEIREQGLRDESEALAEAERHVRESYDELTGKRNEVDAERREIAGEREELLTERDRLESERAEFEAESDERRRELEARDRELDERSETTSTLAAEVDEQRRELAERACAVEARAKQLDGLAATQKELSDARTRLADDRRTLERERRELETERQHFDNEREQLHDERAELASERERLESDSAELETRRTSLENERETFDRETATRAEDQSTLELERSEVAEEWTAVAEQRAEFERRLGEIEAREKDVETREAELESGRKESEERTLVIEEALQELDDRRDALTDRESEFEERVRTLGESERAAEARFETLAQRDEELAERQSDVEARSVVLEVLRRELADERARVEREAEELTSRRREVEERAADLAVRDERLSQRENELEGRERAIEERETAGSNVDAESIELQDRRREMESKERELEEREHRLATWAADMEDRESQLEELEAALDHERARLSDEQRTIEESSRRVDEEREVLETRLAEVTAAEVALDVASCEAVDREQALVEEDRRRHESERTAWEEERQAFETELAQAHSALAEERTKLDSDRKDLEQRLEELATEQRHLDEERKAALDGEREETHREREELERQREELAVERERLVAERDTFERERSDWEEESRQCNERRGELEALESAVATDRAAVKQEREELNRERESLAGEREEWEAERTAAAHAGEATPPTAPESDIVESDGAIVDDVEDVAEGGALFGSDAIPQATVAESETETDNEAGPVFDAFASDVFGGRVDAESGDEPESSAEPSYLDGLQLDALFGPASSNEADDDERAPEAFNEDAEGPDRSTGVDESTSPFDSVERSDEPVEARGEDVSALRSTLAEMFDLPPGEAAPRGAGAEFVDAEAEDEREAFEENVPTPEAMFDAAFGTQPSESEPVEPTEAVDDATESGSGVDVEAADPATPDADEPGEEEDDSIAAYMERLLARNRSSRAGNAAEPTQPKQPEPSTPAPAAPTPNTTADGTEYEPATTDDELPPSEPAAPKHVVDRDALMADIASMRHVANLSARTAIATSAWRRMKGTIIARAVLFGVCVVVAGVLVSTPYWAKQSHASIGWLAVVAAIVMGFELGRAVRALRTASREEERTPGKATGRGDVERAGAGTDDESQVDGSGAAV